MKKILTTLFILFISISVFADHYDDGLAYAERGNHKQAFQSFELALLKSPNDLKILKAYANSAFHSRQYIHAIPVYEKMLQNEPNNTECLVRLAKMYSYSTQKYKSADFGERAMALNLQKQEEIIQLAETFFFIKNYKDALTLYGRLDGNDMATHKMAKSYAKMGNFPQAVEQYEKLINRGSKNPVHFYELGNALYDNGSYMKAAIILKKADALGFTNKKNLYLNIAYAYSNVRKHDEALVYMKKTLGTDPYDKNLNLDMADFLIRSGQFRSARVHINDMLKKFPNDAEVIYTLGMSYHKEGNSSKAEHWFNIAFQKNPSLKSLRYTKNGQ